MPTLTNQTSVRSKIYWSCGSLVLACVLGNIAGWLGQRVLLSNIDAHEKAEQVSEDILRVDRATLELKARAEAYVQTGVDSAYEAALQIQRQLNIDLDELQAKNQDSDLAEVLPQMQGHLKTFGEQLTLAADERKLASELVQVTLPEQDTRVDEAIETLRESLNAHRDASVRFDKDANALIKAISEFAAARKHTMAYFIQPASDRYKQALSNLAESRWQFAAIRGDDESIEIRYAIESALKEVDLYRALATRAVQATRGYMFYVNVVMAGEISEFSYYSNELKRLVENKQVESRLARQSSVRSLKIFSIAASLGAVLLAAALAIRLAKLILQPITLLTDTFLSLSRGETVEHIPASDRTDEIGRMAQAAAVFSDKNVETQTLLDRSQTLTEELADKAAKLEETNSELDNFAYVASHDLKSPLRGIKCLSEWVSEDCQDSLSEESKKHLHQMQTQVNKMEGLLDDLLHYSRVGRTEHASEVVDLNQLVDSVIEFVDNPSGMTIAADGELPVVTTYKTPLQQVLMNLITNAIKYNDKGSDGRLSVSVQDQGDRLRFSVCDNGIGIDPIFHERIFQMYQRVATKQADGAGMGLAIVKRQVECQGGTIQVESIVGEGSIFAFTWPIASNNRADAVSASTLSSSLS